VPVKSQAQLSLQSKPAKGLTIYLIPLYGHTLPHSHSACPVCESPFILLIHPHSRSPVNIPCMSKTSSTKPESSEDLSPTFHNDKLSMHPWAVCTPGITSSLFLLTLFCMKSAPSITSSSKKLAPHHKILGRKILSRRSIVYPKAAHMLSRVTMQVEGGC
jgi:hypothetical protein